MSCHSRARLLRSPEFLGMTGWNKSWGKIKSKRFVEMINGQINVVSTVGYDKPYEITLHDIAVSSTEVLFFEEKPLNLTIFISKMKRSWWWMMRSLIVIF